MTGESNICRCASWRASPQPRWFWASGFSASARSPAAARQPRHAARRDPPPATTAIEPAAGPRARRRTPVSAGRALLLPLSPRAALAPRGAVKPVACGAAGRLVRVCARRRRDPRVSRAPGALPPPAARRSPPTRRRPPPAGGRSDGVHPDAAGGRAAAAAAGHGPLQRRVLRVRAVGRRRVGRQRAPPLHDRRHPHARGGPGGDRGQHDGPERRVHRAPAGPSAAGQRARAGAFACRR